MNGVYIISYVLLVYIFLLKVLSIVYSLLFIIKVLGVKSLGLISIFTLPIFEGKVYKLLNDKPNIKTSRKNPENANVPTNETITIIFFLFTLFFSVNM